MALVYLTILGIRKRNQRHQQKAALDANMGNLADFASAPLETYSTQQGLRPVLGGLVPTSQLAYQSPRRGKCYGRHSRYGGYRQCGGLDGGRTQVYACKHQRKCANNCNHADPSYPIENCRYRQECQRTCVLQNQQSFAGLALADADDVAVLDGWNHDEKAGFDPTGEQVREYDEVDGHDKEEDHLEQKTEMKAVHGTEPPTYTYSDRALLTTV